MKKIILILITSFSAFAWIALPGNANTSTVSASSENLKKNERIVNSTEDYNHHYFTGLYSLERNKQYDGSVDTKYFHIYNGMGYVEGDNEGRYLEPILPDNKTRVYAVTNLNTRLWFDVNKGVIRNLKVYPQYDYDSVVREKKLTNECSISRFIFDYKKANHLSDFNNLSGPDFRKYDYEFGNAIVYVFKDRNILRAIKIDYEFNTSDISEERFKLDVKSSNKLIPADKNDKDEYLKIINCKVINYKSKL